MNTQFPYNNGGETLTEVIEGIWENLNVPDEKGARVVVLAKEAMLLNCSHSLISTAD